MSHSLKTAFSSLLLLMSFALFTNALYFTMDGQKTYCFYKNFEKINNYNYSISYVVSGVGEDQVAATVNFNSINNENSIKNYNKILFFLNQIMKFSISSLEIIYIPLFHSSFFLIKLANPNGVNVFNVRNERDFYMELDPTINGEYKLCFDNLDGNSKILSFDIIEPLEANAQYANQGDND